VGKTDERRDSEGQLRAIQAQPPVRSMDPDARHDAWNYLRPFFPERWTSDPLALTAFIGQVVAHLPKENTMDIQMCREMMKGAFGFSLAGPLGVCVPSENDRVKVVAPRY
jgi:hypothetical protein